MKETPQFATTYFKSFEQREQAFRDSVCSLIPRKYSGPRLFWNDFTSVSLEELSAFTGQRLSYITSNPRDGLAFGTPWQVLKAAAMCARDADQASIVSVEDVAREFDIFDFLHQPIRTLSGGETVKLALAKASVASIFTDKLIFCLGGDVFLALPQERMFLFVLVSFLLGHVFYVIGFFYVADLNPWTWGGSAIGLAISGRVFFWLRPHLGSMLVPVMAYIIVITAMVAGAFTVLGDAGLHSTGRFLVIFGAVSFYISDLFVARDRILRRNLSIGSSVCHCIMGGSYF